MDRVAYQLYRVLAALICALPIEWSFRAGSALGTVVFWVAWPYRRLVLDNLRIAFGSEKSAAELRSIARRHFASLGGNLFTSVKIPRLSRDELLARVTVEGLEHVEAAVSAGVGIVPVISHLGSWETFAQLSPMLFPCKVGTVFQRLGNPLMDAAVRRDRARLGLELFERKEGLVAASRFLRAGGACGVLVDQHAGDGGIWCPFFNRLASTSSLAATLALRTGARLIPMAVYTAGVARWRLSILPPVDATGLNPETATAWLNQVLEGQIREQPHDWFWVHNRWKTPKPKFLLATYRRGVVADPGSLQPFRILIRASNWLGDAVMSAPAVRAIKRGRPDAHVTILTPAKLADLWRSEGDVDEVMAIEAGESVFAVARRIRRGFDAAIVFPNSFRVALEVWLAGIPRRVGYPGHARSALLNQVWREKKKAAQSGPQRHQVHHYLQLAEFIGAEISTALALEPQRTPIARLDAPPVLGLCAGAEYGPAKRWLPERFAEVMRLVHERHQGEWKLFGVAKDREVIDAITTAAGVPALDLVGKTTLAELIAELRTCRLLVTNDTGTMHLAAHLGVPVVAIFGSTEPALTGPLGDAHRVLRHHVECSPCFLRECPIDFRCMKAVSVDEAVTAVERLLAAR